MKFYTQTVIILLMTFGLINIVNGETFKVQFLKGNVKFKNSAKQKWQKAKVGKSINEKGSIKTAKKGAVILKMSDGSQIKIGENSFVTAKTLTAQKTDIKLKKGSLIAKVKKLQRKRQFNISTLTVVAGVRGTQFAVIENTQAKEAQIGVKEGFVDVSHGREVTNVSQGNGLEEQTL